MDKNSQAHRGGGTGQPPDLSASVFGNEMPASILRKADRRKSAYLRKYGEDEESSWYLGARELGALGGLGLRELMVETAGAPAGAIDLSRDEKALVIGNIRMGYGHYRISMAVASAARHRGLKPYWLDLHSFMETAGGKIVHELNGLYSLGSRLSQRFSLFNRLYWEPLNSEGFRKLSYNAVDQRVSELMAGPCRLLPQDIPFVATHAWPAQAALHAGMRRVVNAVPDNWPMALHLAEGAIHCVQGPSAWQGYRLLRGMAGKHIARPMPAGSLRCVGHFVDHEIVSNLEADTKARMGRLTRGAPLRVLFSLGGAGAQKALNQALLARLLPLAEAGKLCLLVNAGDHRDLMEGMMASLPGLRRAFVHSNDWEGTKAFAAAALKGRAEGIHLFHHQDIFAAVYATNLLMRAADLLVTKPSELAYYPVPKLHLRRVGGHEAWGAIRSAELGDGSVECSTEDEALAMLELMLSDGEALALMNESILAAHRAGAYDGAYRVVDIALGKGARL